MQTELSNESSGERPQDEGPIQQSVEVVDNPMSRGSSSTDAVPVEPTSSTSRVAQATAGDADRPETIVVHPSMPDPANYRDLGGQNGIVERHESPYVFDARNGQGVHSPAPFDRSAGSRNEAGVHNVHRDTHYSSGLPVFIRTSSTRPSVLGPYGTYGRRATSIFVPPASNPVPPHTSTSSGLFKQRSPHHYGAFIAEL